MASSRGCLLAGSDRTKCCGPTFRRRGGIARFEPLVRGLRTSTGVFRTTRRGRFSSINVIINEHLRECFDSSANSRLHDWATSDGLAAMEWATELTHAKLIRRETVNESPRSDNCIGHVQPSTPAF